MKRNLALLVLAIGALAVTVLPLVLATTGDASAQGGSAAGVAGLPPVLGQAYTAGAARALQLVPGCTGMRWEILAGVAQVESTQATGHQIAADGQISPPIYGPLLDGSGAGGNTTPVLNTSPAERTLDGGTRFARAVGPFQFMPATWLADGLNGRGTSAAADPQNAFDAALTAAVYLCGKGRDLSQPPLLAAALYAYNHSDAYVSQVEGAIAQFDALATMRGRDDHRDCGRAGGDRAEGRARPARRPLLLGRRQPERPQPRHLLFRGRPGRPPRGRVRLLRPDPGGGARQGDAGLGVGVGGAGEAVGADAAVGEACRFG